MSSSNSSSHEKGIVIFAFLLHTDFGYFDHPSARQTFIVSQDDKTKMENFVRARTGKQNADVKLFLPPDWNPPSIKSIDQSEISKNFRLIQQSMRKVLQEFGVPNLRLDSLTNEVDGAPNPSTGTVLFWIVYNE